MVVIDAIKTESKITLSQRSADRVAIGVAMACGTAECRLQGIFGWTKEIGMAQVKLRGKRKVDGDS